MYIRKGYKDMIKNLIFDVGGVLFDYRWKEMFMDYGLDEDNAIRVGTQMFNDPDRTWDIFDLGIKSDEEITDIFCKKYPGDEDVIRWFIRHGEYMQVPRPKVWKKVHELKQKGYKIYILSNYPESLFKKHTEYADFMDDIDGLMVSYMIHKAKPAEDIYKALCDKYGLDRSESIFFDDRSENVEGAIKFGMKSVKILSEQVLLDELDRF
ncbi:HAD family phosphatase [Clostridium sp. AM27-31LB]|jgi:putative hydrolase of the HAD superfamily|nr:HAD family phosphatase [Clostridium sp. AM27-31LB]